MAERNYYVLCESNCKFPAMTKEQVLAAIAEATGNTVTAVDDAFITKVKELNANASLKFWIGTTAEYNAIAVKDDYTLYILTDDDTPDALNEIAKEIEEIRRALGNVEHAKTAGHAETADSAASAATATTATNASKVLHNGAYKSIGEILNENGTFNTNGNYPNVTVGQATNAGSAVKAEKDGDGKNIAATYWKNGETTVKTTPVYLTAAGLYSIAAIDAVGQRWIDFGVIYFNGTKTEKSIPIVEKNTLKVYTVVIEKENGHIVVRVYKYNVENDEAFGNEVESCTVRIVRVN